MGLLSLAGATATEQTRRRKNPNVRCLRVLSLCAKKFVGGLAVGCAAYSPARD